MLPFDLAADFDGAVRVYRRCRAAGVTPRGLVDCMVTAIAWRTGATLLARDVDLEGVAGVLGVELEPPRSEPAELVDQREPSEFACFVCHDEVVPDASGSRRWEGITDTATRMWRWGPVVVHHDCRLALVTPFDDQVGHGMTATAEHRRA